MDHPTDPTPETPAAIAKPTSSDTGCLIVAATFAATPLLLLFGNLGGALQPLIMIAALVVGIPTAWRRIKSGRNPTMIILLLIGTFMLFGLLDGYVQWVLGPTPR